MKFKKEITGDMSYIGCLALTSAIIEKAVVDFATLPPNGRFHQEFYSAKKFIFTDLGEEFLKRCGLEETWSIDYIRRKALNMRQDNKFTTFVTQESL